jgi:hypothetical protein
MHAETRNAVRRRLLRLRDVLNTLRYGSQAPRYAERIWVRPRAVRYALHGPGYYLTCSGRVISIEENFQLVDLLETSRIKSAFSHWVDGVPWELTPDYRVTLDAVANGKDWGGCSTEDDLRARFHRLDRIFEQTRTDRRLKTRKELDPSSFREEGGILVCIGKGGEPLLYDGFHRFAIALILDLPAVPAQLGFVDEAAIGSVQQYREPPVDMAGART